MRIRRGSDEGRADRLRNLTKEVKKTMADVISETQVVHIGSSGDLAPRRLPLPKSGWTKRKSSRRSAQQDRSLAGTHCSLADCSVTRLTRSATLLVSGTPCISNSIFPKGCSACLLLCFSASLLLLSSRSKLCQVHTGLRPSLSS